MPTYIYIQSPSDKRGYNVHIRVYKIVRNKPKRIGDGDYNSASWYGARGEACEIIRKVEKYQLGVSRRTGQRKTFAGHPGDFQRQDIEVIEV